MLGYLPAFSHLDNIYFKSLLQTSFSGMLLMWNMPSLEAPFNSTHGPTCSVRKQNCPRAGGMGHLFGVKTSKEIEVEEF